MRAFLGVPVKSDLRDKIMLAQRRFLQFDIKFVEPENFHFNLKFFDNLSEDKIGDVKAAVIEACRNFSPFEIKIAGVGAFPSKERARVVWLGVGEGRDMLVSLGISVQKEIQNAGLGQAEDFVPHLTLGRVRSADASIARRIEEMKDFEAGTMSVNRIVLFKSTLGPSGPVYEEVFSEPLSFSK